MFLDHATQSSCKTQMAVARMAYDRGLYTAALRNYKAALKCSKQLGLSEAQLIPVQLGLAMCLCQRGSFDEAETLYKKLIQLDCAPPVGNQSSRALELNNLAILYKKVGKTNQAEGLLDQAVKVLEDCGNTDRLLLAAVLKTLSQVYCDGGKVEDAQRCIETTLELFETTIEKQSILFGEVLITMAVVAAKRVQTTEAVELIDRAISILELVSGGEHPDLAVDLKIAAQIMRQEGFIEKAEALLKRADRITDHLKEIDH